MKTFEQMCREMLTIRVLEDKLQKYCDEGRAGDLHFNKGQEAIAVGVCSALRDSDCIVTHHRTIAHAIAKGVPMRALAAELLGKSSGVCGGRAGEMHLSYPPVGYDFSFQIVGTCIPVAAGIAWAEKYHRKSDRVVAVFFGDACTSNGQFHEGLNIAAIQEVPLILICENNRLAGNIAPYHYMTSPNDPDRTICKRARSYGIQALAIGGNDVMSVSDIMEEAVAEVRRTGKPVLVEMLTERLCWHKQGQRDVRSKETLDELAKNEPLVQAQTTIELGRLSFDMAKERAELEKQVGEMLESIMQQDNPPEVFHD